MDEFELLDLHCGGEKLWQRDVALNHRIVFTFAHPKGSDKCNQKSVTLFCLASIYTHPLPKTTGVVGRDDVLVGGEFKLTQMSYAICSFNHQVYLGAWTFGVIC